MTSKNAIGAAAAHWQVPEALAQAREEHIEEPDVPRARGPNHVTVPPGLGARAGGPRGLHWQAGTATGRPDKPRPAAAAEFQVSLRTGPAEASCHCRRSIIVLVGMVHVRY